MHNENSPEKVALANDDGTLTVREMDSDTAWIRSDTVIEAQD